MRLSGFLACEFCRRALPLMNLHRSYGFHRKLGVSLEGVEAIVQWRRKPLSGILGDFWIKCTFGTKLLIRKYPAKCG